jgi:hypothetical protein
MALADEIRTLQDRVLADLNSAHDYYADTKIAWRLVNDLIAAGHTITSRNTTTGTLTTQAELAAKASRDVLVHNKGIANKTYESKAGNLARFREGEELDIPEDYHRETWELIHKVVADVSNAAIAKVA